MPGGVLKLQGMLSTIARGARKLPRSFESLRARSRLLKRLVPVVGSCVPEFGSPLRETVRVSGTSLRSNLTRFPGLLASCQRGKALCFALLAVSSKSLVVLLGLPQPYFQVPDPIAIASIIAVRLLSSSFNHLDQILSHAQGRDSPTGLTYRAEKVAEDRGEALFTAGVIPYLQRLHSWA